MATETVSAFTPVSLGFNKDTINGFALKCENDLNFEEHTSVADINSPIAQSYYKRMTEMTERELHTAREMQLIEDLKRQENTKLEKLETIKQENAVLENGNHENDTHDLNNGEIESNNLDRLDEDQQNGKKKRIAKKRNRSDMPPEELMRLRERERKAQQSRRDRIRAQKRHAQGWHDDDAAWEAFLDQAESNNDNTDDLKPNFVNSLPPSMVCSISSSRSSPKDEMFANELSPVDLNMLGREVKEGMKEHEPEDEHLTENLTEHLTAEHLSDRLTERLDEHLVNGTGGPDHKKIIQKQDSVHSNDTDTNSASSYLDTQSLHYSSDDKPMDCTLTDDQKENGKKKLSRRHYLPSDELERLRKRERETKRRQRERHRLANTESTSPVKSNSTLSSNDTEYIEDIVNEPEMKCSDSKKYDILQKSEQFKSIERHRTPPPDSSVIPLVVPPKPMLNSTSESHMMAVTPHTHHLASNHHNRHYPSLVYMSNTTHHHYHYSHSPTSYMRDGRHHASDAHYPRYAVEDRHYHSEPYKLDGGGYHKNHGLPHVIPVVHRPTTSADGMSSPEHKPKMPSSTSPTNVSSEKKKLISRNVDRKKLSEEELEELRRRERDYQRERRARIRMEKAKSQANHEQYSQKPRDDGLSHYYHPSPVYRPHSALHMYHDDYHHRDREKPVHVMPNCESDDRYDYRQYSPHCTSKNSGERKDVAATMVNADLRHERKQLTSSDDGKENDMLQVVPKTRECEEMSSSPPQVTPNKTHHVTSRDVTLEGDEAKKNDLESISCTTKKDADEWTENSGSYYGDNDENEECDDKLVIVHPSTCQDKDERDAKRSGDACAVTKVIKEELMNGTSMHSSASMKSDDMSLRDRIMEDQLERRRRSNREAQRRRRARLKIQESSEDRPDSADEILDYDLLRGPKPMHVYSDDVKLGGSHVIPPKGCRMKVTPQLRPDSLYADDYHSYHGHHNGKVPYNHGYDRYGGGGHGHPPAAPHQVEKHCYYTGHRSSKEIDSHRYPHYFREQSKIERYIHDLPPGHYSNHHGDHHGDHHGNATHVHDGNDRKKCARVPSIDHYDHHDEPHRNELDVNTEDPSPPAPNSPSKISTPKYDTENELDTSKQCGRKRKQNAPRKVVSTSNTPEEDIDVCTVGESPEEISIYKSGESPEEKSIYRGDIPRDESTANIFHLNGDVNYDNISSQQKIDDMHYLYR